MGESSLFIISGASGSGKTTLTEGILLNIPLLEKAITTTTRSPRKKKDGTMEKDGEDYHFSFREKFLEDVQAGMFFEWAEIYGNLYGNNVNEVQRIRESNRVPLFVVDIQGLITLKEKIESAITIFIYPPNLKSLRERLTRRGDQSEVIDRRMAEAYSEIQRGATHSLYHIVNADLTHALDDLSIILKSELQGARAGAYLDPPSLKNYS